MKLAYHPVAATFWDDAKVRSMTEDERSLAIYFLTCPLRQSEGFYGLPIALALDHLQWDRARLEKAAQGVCAKRFAEYDLEAQAVLVLKGLKYNDPGHHSPGKSPSHTRISGAIKGVEGAPSSSRLFALFLAAADRYSPHFARALRARYEIPPTADRASIADPPYGDGDGDGVEMNVGDGAGVRDGVLQEGGTK